MKLLIRRSNLLVPVLDAAALASAWRQDADALTLDLEASVAQAHKASARGLIRDALLPCARGAAEVFVRVNKPYLYADLAAAVWPGLRGIVLPDTASASDVRDADAALSALERERGLVVGSVQLIVQLDGALGVWQVRSIVEASPRVSQVGMDETDLAASLGIALDSVLDPFVYARGRLVIEAIASKVSPIGMSYPLSVHAGPLDYATVHAAATKARNLGMKGVLCPHPSWVAPVNAAFTPTPELVAYNQRVREAFAAGVAAGTAAVPLDGRMIDVPVDEWAIVVLAMADACAARDAEKKAALART